MRKKRRRRMAAVLSVLCPGLGQVYNRQRGKGLLFGAIAVVLLLSYRSRLSTEETLLMLMFPYHSLWGYSIVDVWYDAKGADELAERFTKTLSPTSPLPLEKCSRFSRPDVITRFKKSLYVCNVWIRDFFRMRGDLAHGKVTPLYPSLWSLPTHLLLASFVYPLLLKKVLVEEGVYTLSEEDQFQIDLFEPLAGEELFVFATTSQDPPDDPWNRVVGGAGW